MVEGSLKEGDEEGDEPLKESIIAMEVFDRGSSYDPSIDATVRVEAGRLRSRLRDYYGVPAGMIPSSSKFPEEPIDQHST